MSVDLLPSEEVRKLAWSCLKGFGSRYMTEEYFGEMLTEAYSALSDFDPSKNAQPSTLIYSYCKNRMCKIIRREKEYYKQHKFYGNMELYPSSSRTPYFYTAKYEMVEAILNSDLSKRTKDVVLTLVDFPEETYDEVGKRLGVSKQAVHQHLLSAKQYFVRNKIEFTL